SMRPLIHGPQGRSDERDRNVEQYDKLEEFITLMVEMVPELLDYRQTAQLIPGVRAQLLTQVV
uniref:TERF1-interacting nuclear factor 2 N-terminal domain-containing protein n=1 Tax=Mola mola TaxID=94237 RepID=A0A3Q3VMK3_MOLML